MRTGVCTCFFARVVGVHFLNEKTGNFMLLKPVQGMHTSTNYLKLKAKSRLGIYSVCFSNHAVIVKIKLG